ncbi:MAG: alcohol dehydrogenase catalytic domain-containing protein [Xanthobacteraceae bacterium]
MKAWQLHRLGGELRFNDVRTPEPRPGSALVRIEASALMSYLKAYVEGKLPAYNPPPGPFTIGTNGIGVIEAVGRDVWHLKPGQRVVLSSHFVAAENVENPAQILIGLTSSPDAAQVLADLAGRHARRICADAGGGDHAGGRTGPHRRHSARCHRPLHHPLAVCSAAGWRPARRWS